MACSSFYIFATNIGIESSFTLYQDQAYCTLLEKHTDKAIDIYNWDWFQSYIYIFYTNLFSACGFD